MARTVIVSWTTQDQPIVDAEKADHYRITFSTQEVTAPLTARQATFQVEPGTYTAVVAIERADNTPLVTPPLTKTGIIVSPAPVAAVPLEINFSVG